MNQYFDIHSFDSDNTYYFVKGNRGCGRSYAEFYVRKILSSYENESVKFTDHFVKEVIRNCCKKPFKETINSIYGKKEGTGKMKRYKLSYETQNGNGSWYKTTHDKDGEGHTEQELLDALTKGFFRSGVFQNIQFEEIIPKSELFEELFFIQYRAYGEQEIEVEFFTCFRDFCYHIVKISSDLGDILNADKVATTHRGICEGFFQCTKHNKKFNDLYRIIYVDGKKFFREVKA
jgi:hypothetical protein